MTRPKLPFCQWGSVIQAPENPAISRQDRSAKKPGGGEVVETPIEDQTFVYAVNVEGVYRTTKAFAPLIIESKGRIVTTGSIAGTLAYFPGFSAYSGSKHWIEAYTDSLAAEMEPHGVAVSVVEPGNYKSNIRRSSVARRHEIDPVVTMRPLDSIISGANALVVR